MSKSTELLIKASEKPKREGVDSQYKVHLGVPPTKKSANYHMWELNKEELSNVLKNWKSAKWDFAGYGKKSKTNESHHSTAIPRKTPSAPLARHLNDSDQTHKRSLYHGMGKDEPGLKALGKVSGGKAQGYDPFHPDAEKRKAPKGKFDNIHSHYTLNVVDKDTGHDILSHIHGLLSDDGKAVISVRADKSLDSLKKDAVAGYDMVGGAGASGMGALSAPQMDPMMMSKKKLSKSTVDTFKKVTSGYMHPSKDKTSMLPGGGPEKPKDRKHVRADTMTPQDYILEKTDDLEKDKKMSIEEMRANLKKKHRSGGDPKKKIQEAMDRQTGGKGPKDSGRDAKIREALRAQGKSGVGFTGGRRRDPEVPQKESAQDKFNERVGNKKHEDRRRADQVEHDAQEAEFAQRGKELYSKVHGDELAQHSDKIDTLEAQDSHRPPGSSKQVRYHGSDGENHYFSVKGGNRNSYREARYLVKKGGRAADVQRIPNKPDNWHFKYNEEPEMSYKQSLSSDKGEKSDISAVKKHPQVAEIMGKQVKESGHHPDYHPKDYKIEKRNGYYKVQRKHGSKGTYGYSFDHDKNRNIVHPSWKTREGSDHQRVFDHIVRPHIEGDSPKYMDHDEYEEHINKPSVKAEKKWSGEPRREYSSPSSPDAKVIRPKFGKSLKKADDTKPHVKALFETFKKLKSAESPEWNPPKEEKPQISPETPKLKLVKADKSRSSLKKALEIMKKGWSPILSD